MPRRLPNLARLLSLLLWAAGGVLFAYGLIFDRDEHIRTLWALAFVSASLLSVPSVVRDWKARHRAEWARAGLCPSCGYDLTGNKSGTCPKCGTLAPARPAA